MPLSTYLKNELYQVDEENFWCRVIVKLSMDIFSLHHSQTWLSSILSSHIFLSFLPPLHRYSILPSCFEHVLYLHSIFIVPLWVSSWMTKFRPILHFTVHSKEFYEK